MSQSNMGFGMESFDAYSVLSEFGKPSEREESPSIEKFMADMVRASAAEQPAEEASTVLGHSGSTVAAHILAGGLTIHGRGGAGTALDARRSARIREGNRPEGTEGRVQDGRRAERAGRRLRRHG